MNRLKQTLFGDAPVYSGDVFSWHGQVGVVEVSDLADRWLGHIDKSDERLVFHVKSQWINMLKTFRFVSSVVNHDELTEWVFEDETGDVQVRVFND